MEVISISAGSVRIALSPDELLIFNQSMNEVANGVQIPDWEFSTRLGCQRAEVQALLTQVNDLLRRLDETPDDGL